MIPFSGLKGNKIHLQRTLAPERKKKRLKKRGKETLEQRKKCQREIEK